MIARHAAALAGVLVLAARPAPVTGTGDEPILPLPAVQQPFFDACPLGGFWINAGWWIDGIQVACADGATHPQRGGTGGGRNMFSLAPGERIVAISGLAGGNSGPHLYALQIHTDRRSSPVYGNGGAAQGDPGRIPFRLDVPPGYTLVGITGRTTEFLRSVGLVLAGPQAGG